MKKTKFETVITYGFAAGILMMKLLGLVLQLQQAACDNHLQLILRDNLLPPVYALLVWYVFYRYRTGKAIAGFIIQYPITGVLLPVAAAALGIIHYDPLLYPLMGCFAMACVMRTCFSFQAASMRLVPTCTGLILVAILVGHDLFGSICLIAAALILSLNADDLYKDFSAVALLLEVLYLTAALVIVVLTNKNVVFESAFELTEVQGQQYLLSNLVIEPLYIGIPLLFVPFLIVFFCAGDLAQSNKETYPPFVIAAFSFLMMHAWTYWTASAGWDVFHPMEIMAGTFLENLVFYLLVLVILPADHLLPQGRAFERPFTPIDMDAWIADSLEVSEKGATELLDLLEFAPNCARAWERLPEFYDYLSEEQLSALLDSDAHKKEEVC